MTDTADLNLVLGRILPDDALHERAKRHLDGTGPLVVPTTVGIELLFAAERFDGARVDVLGAAQAHFDLEAPEVLYTAAEALDAGDVATVFDALHLADALHRGGKLHTADEELQGTAFGTVGF